MSLAYSVKQLKEGIGELLEHQENARSIEEFERYADDPVGFITEVLGDDLTEAQTEVAEAVRSHLQVAVRGCHGSGKDWLAARLALWWVYTRQGLAILTGPTERQVKEILMRRELRRAWRGRRLPGDLFEMALRLDNNEQAGILAFTASDPDRFTGHHAPAVLIVITEGQGVEPEIYEAAQKVLTGEQSRLLVVGNANRPIGRFYEIHRSPAWVKVKISAFDHPNVQTGKELIPGAVTRQWVDGIEAEYGRDSPFWQAAVLAEFPENADEALVQRSWLEAAARRWEHEHGPLNGALVLAVDPARYGADKTALVVRRGRRLHEIILWAKASTMETANRVVHAALARGMDSTRSGWGTVKDSSSMSRWMRNHLPPNTSSGQIVVDEVGLGGGVLDRLHELGWKVEGFNGGASPEGRNADRFSNARAEAYWTIRKLLEEGAVDLPRDPYLWEELQETRWATNSKGEVQIEPKDMLKAQIGRSPDRADAVVMAFWIEHRTGALVDPSLFTPIKK